jgi:hypothetical protein
MGISFPPMDVGVAPIPIWEIPMGMQMSNWSAEAGALYLAGFSGPEAHFYR